MLLNCIFHMCSVFQPKVKMDDFMKWMGISYFANKCGVGLPVPEDFVFSLVGKANSENPSEASVTNTYGNREVKWLVQVYMCNYGKKKSRSYLSSFLPSFLPPFLPFFPSFFSN